MQRYKNYRTDFYPESMTKHVHAVTRHLGKQVRVTKKELEKYVDLMLVINDDDEGHYCWIKGMSRLLAGRKTQWP